MSSKYETTKIVALLKFQSVIFAEVYTLPKAVPVRFVYTYNDSRGAVHYVSRLGNQRDPFILLANFRNQHFLKYICIMT
jgi:hypothetical protein